MDKLKELWKYRELFYYFTIREIKLRYSDKYLGVLWAIIQPIFLAIILSFLFKNRFEPQGGSGSYFTFAFCGLIFWQIFSNTILNIQSNIAAHSELIKKVYFPRIILPLSSLNSSFFDFIFGGIVFLGFLIYTAEYSTNIFIVFLATALCAIYTYLSTVGYSLLFTSLSFQYRDFQFVIPYLVQLGFFLGPVLYTYSEISNPIVQALIILNPISGPIELYRSLVFNVDLSLSFLAMNIGFSIIWFFLGMYSFKKMEIYFADLI